MLRTTQPAVGGVLALALLATAVAVVHAPDPAAAQTLDDLDRLERRVEGIEDHLDVVTTRYEGTWAAIEATQIEIDGLRARVRALRTEVARVEASLGDRARSAFKRGSTSTVQALLASEGSQAVVERAGLLAALQLRERARVEDALAARTRLGQTRALVEDRQHHLDGLQARLADEAVELQAALEGAQREASQVRSLVARQRRIDRGPQRGIYACIFDRGALRFRDTWGAPRSGGRRHKGTDVFAAMGAPVYAITAGVVQRHSNSRLGGISLYLRGDDGNVYFYTHLRGYGPRGAVGTRVVAGQHVAYNGNTGNARGGAPHVHFEVHPGGGAPINPYAWLAAACH